MLAKHALYQLSYGPFYALRASKGGPIEGRKRRASGGDVSSEALAKEDGRPGQI